MNVQISFNRMIFRLKWLPMNEHPIFLEKTFVNICGGFKTDSFALLMENYLAKKDSLDCKTDPLIIKQSPKPIGGSHF